MPQATVMRDMFDKVAWRYDMANRVLSAGSDRHWRKAVAQEVARGNPSMVLDLCSGTADQAMAIHAEENFQGRVICTDISAEMLLLGREKMIKSDSPSDNMPGLSHDFVLSDVHRMALRPGIFDCATICFGVRNFDQIVEGLKEVRRVLKPGGKLVILEFTRPQNRVLWGLYRQYLTKFLPLLGGMLTGQLAAYRYLASSIDAFLTPSQLMARLQEAGFTNIRHRFLSAGIVAITTAIKTESIPLLCKEGLGEVDAGITKERRP